MKKVKLGEVTINIDNRRKPLNNLQRIEKSLTKKYPYCGANNIIDFIDEYIFDENEEILCIAEDGGSWGKDEECTYVMNEKCWVNNHAHVLKMKTGVDINYIKLNLDYLDLTSYITGSTRGKLTKSSLEKIELKLPDYHTQISISKRISDIQKLITKKKDQIQKYKELVKSRFNEMFGDPINNDKKFAEKTGQQCFKFSSGKFLDKNDRVFEGYPAYGGNGIAWKSRNYLIDNPTIIIGRVGAYCGNVRTTHGKVWISDNAIYIKEFKNLDFNLVFLLELMKVIDFSRFADFSGQPKITQKPLEKQKYILPPLSLQNEFADFVAQVDKSQLAIQKSLEELETLKKSLMQEYFG